MVHQSPLPPADGSDRTGDQSLAIKVTYPKIAALSNRPQPATTLQCSVCCQEFGYWHSLRSHQKTCGENGANSNCAAAPGDQNLLSKAAGVTGSSKTPDAIAGTQPAGSSSDDCAATEVSWTQSEPSERFDKMAIMMDGRCRFRCDSCSYVASGLASMRQHYTQHTGERPFACEQCGARYRLLNSLRKHMMRTHERVRQYDCAECGRQFADKGELQAHRRAHADQRVFACEKCGAQFGYRASLKAHMRTHDVEPAFRCEDCAKTFTHVSSYKVHMKRHRGELNYQCDECAKSFVDKVQLRRHLAVHSEERPFVCKVCGATFKLRKYLQSHQRTHRKKKAPVQDSDDHVDEDSSSD